MACWAKIALDRRPPSSAGIARRRSSELELEAGAGSRFRTMAGVAARLLREPGTWCWRREDSVRHCVTAAERCLSS